MQGFSVRRKRDVLVFLMLTLCFAFVYVGFASVNYDTNGLQEARAMDQGVLFFPNHLLNRFWGFLANDFARRLGYSGISFLPVQVLSALSAAVGIGCAYLAFASFSTAGAALAGACLLGVSWSYWTFSGDGAYISIAVMAAASCLALVLRARSLLSFVGGGLLLAVAILTWQASVLLVPVVILTALVRSRSAGGGMGWKGAAAAAATAAVAVGSCYLAIAVFACGIHTLSEISAWASGYGGGRLRGWGAWNIDRLGVLWNTMIQSAVGRISRTVPAAALSVLAAIAAAGLLLDRGRSSGGHLVWALSGILSCGLFALWWVPEDPKWFVMVNLFLVSLWVLLAGPAFSLGPLKVTALVAIAVIGTGNFMNSVWPSHSTLSPERRRAECVAGLTTAADVVVVADWMWDQYLSYVHGRETISLIGETAYFRDKARMFGAVDQAIEKHLASGGRVYIVDPASYSAEYLDWLRAQTGLTVTELSRWPTRKAFECEGMRFLEIVGLPGEGGG